MKRDICLPAEWEPQSLVMLTFRLLRHGAHYHEYFGREQQIQIAVTGHYESEQFTISLLEEIINDRCPEVRTVQTETCTNPIRYY